MEWKLSELEEAATLVHETVGPTPAIAWPTLAARCGMEVVVKHENHLPTGAFKVRGGLVYVRNLLEREPNVHTLVAATRGNHGQSIAFAARAAGLATRIVVPKGNSRDKNAAMRAWGAELVEYGRDFQDAYEYAIELARGPDCHFVPSFDWTLVRGVASWALELFRQTAPLDWLYVPIGLGSGACGAIAARDALVANTHIVGVVAERAPAYACSFREGRAVSIAVSDTIADGLAVRVPSIEALPVLQCGLARLVEVEEAEIRAAMRCYFTDTHNVAEGAGAAALAAVMRDAPNLRGARVGVVLSGGNVDGDLYASVLDERS